MLTEKPDSAAYQESALLRGESLYLLGRHADAISILKDAVRINESAYMLVSSYLLVHDVPHSVQAFAEMFAVAPNSAAAHLITGQMTLRQELNDEGEAQLQQALALDAKLPQAHFFLEGLYMVKGLTEQAAQKLKTELAFNPDSVV